MNFDNVSRLLAVLALVANALVAATLVGLVATRLTPAGRAGWSRLREAVCPYALPLAFIVATIATTSSLYFQYGVGFTPCLLCWYQRIAMYPLSLLLGLTSFRGDLTVAKRYMLPLPIVGAVISTYHYQLERNPSEPTLSCGYGEPVCSQALFNIFGFISIPYMALSAFLLIVTLLLLAREPGDTWDEDDDEAEATSVDDLTPASRRG